MSCVHADETSGTCLSASCLWNEVRGGTDSAHSGIAGDEAARSVEEYRVVDGVHPHRRVGQTLKFCAISVSYRLDATQSEQRCHTDRPGDARLVVLAAPPLNHLHAEKQDKRRIHGDNAHDKPSQDRGAHVSSSGLK